MVNKPIFGDLLNVRFEKKALGLGTASLVAPATIAGIGSTRYGQQYHDWANQLPEYYRWGMGLREDRPQYEEMRNKLPGGKSRVIQHGVGTAIGRILRPLNWLGFGKSMGEYAGRPTQNRMLSDLFGTPYQDRLATPDEIVARTKGKLPESFARASLDRAKQLTALPVGKRTALRKQFWNTGKEIIPTKPQAPMAWPTKPVNPAYDPRYSISKAWMRPKDIKKQGSAMNEVSKNDKAFAEGFATKCAEMNIDPEQLFKTAMTLLEKIPVKTAAKVSVKKVTEAVSKLSK